jgi:hypothetical protein
MSEFTVQLGDFNKNGFVRIEVSAEIIGAWAVTRSIESEDTESFCVTHVESGKRLPPPFRYEDIRVARRLASKLASDHPQIDPASAASMKLVREACLRFHADRKETEWME